MTAAAVSSLSSSSSHLLRVESFVRIKSDPVSTVLELQEQQCLGRTEGYALILC